MRRVFVGIVVLIATGAGIAHADDREKADALFGEGRALLADGKAEEACARFEQAIRLDPVASGTMLNLGLCNEVLGRSKSALVWFRRAQIRATEHREDDIAREARDRMIRISARVPTVAIELSQPSVAARVEIDGVPVTPTDYGRVEVDPGPHVLDARADGYRTVHLQFEAKDSTPARLRVELVKASPAASGGRSRLALYMTIVGGTLWLGSIGLSAYEKYEVYEPAREAYEKTRDPDDRNRANRAETIVKYGATTMFVAGTAALGVATYLWLRGDGEPRSETAIAPTIGGDSVGLAITGPL